MDNATTFGAQADVYASARPTYPTELFDWIATQAPGTDLVWDVGTGSGQAALSLADKFKQVHATDIDAAQIANAPKHPKIRYQESPAHISGLSFATVDAVTVATALHWFDFEKFWDEVRRVTKPNALFCAWTYHRAKTDDETQSVLIDPILEILETFWSEGNRLSWRGYTKEELGLPFETIELPEFACHLDWTPAQIIAFVRSWSAHKKARLGGHEKTLLDLEKNALSRLSDTPRAFKLPLNMLAARIN